MQNKKTSYNLEHIKWTAFTKYVDLDTGEEITTTNYKTNYTKIKTTKHATINKHKGTIEYTIECKRSIQTRLFNE